MKKIFAILLVAFILIAIGFGVFKYMSVHLPLGISIDKEKYPITGIDISNHTGNIRWDKIQTQGISFAYIKATEGQNFVDPNYFKNIEGAEKAKLKVGEYHFFRFNKSGQSQAQNFLRNVKVKPGKLVPCVDVEEWSNLSSKTDLEIKKEIHNFLNIVEFSFQRKMIIYTNENAYNRFIKGEFPDNPIWICSFSKNPKLPDNRQWLFWQHAHNGKLHGAQGSVDINTFNGGINQWEEYINSL